MSYEAVHRQVASRKGRASEWGCAFCAVPAAQWAYNHDPLMEWVSDSGLPYSPEPDDFIPLCLDCHRQLDTPGGYPGYKGRVNVEPHPRSYGALRRDMTPHIWQE